MGIDFNTFSNQDEYTLVLQKRYNAQGKEIATGVSYIFMDTIQEYINAGYLKDNNIDGQENVFSNTDKRNLYNKLVEIYERSGKDSAKDYRKKYSGDTFTYTKDEIFELAEAAGYVVTNPITEPAAETEEEPAEVQPESEETAPAVDEVHDKEVEPAQVEEPDGNPYIVELLNSDPEVQALGDKGYVEINFAGEIIGLETGEVLYEDYNTDITPLYVDGSAVSGTEQDETHVTQGKESKEPDAIVPKAPEDKEIASVPAVTLYAEKEENSALAETEQVIPAPVEVTEDVQDETPVSAATEQVIPAPVEVTEEVQDETPVSAAADEETTAQELTHEEKLAQITSQKRELEKRIIELKKTSTTTTSKKRFLGLSVGTKTTTREYTQDELAERAAQRAELEQQLEELKKEETWVRQYEGPYWISRTGNNHTVLDDGTYSSQSNAYKQVTTNDGHRIAQVTTGYENGKTLYAYYEVMAAKVGDESLGHGHDYYDVVPDFSKKLDITDDQIQ